MQTKRKILESRHFDFELGSEDHMYDVMDAWAKPAVDALKRIQERVKKYEGYHGPIPLSKDLGEIISEALKQYKQ